MSGKTNEICGHEKFINDLQEIGKNGIQTGYCPNCGKQVDVNVPILVKKE